MKISLLENGLDSLKKGFEYLTAYEEAHFIENQGNDRFLILKDAVLAIHHGIEILFKEALNKTNEILLFSEINRNLKSAFAIKRSRKLSSLFEADPTLHTVNFLEAIDRVQKICGHEIPKSFLEKLQNLQNYRNQITHSEVSIDEIEINSVFDGLVDDVDVFFTKAIGKEYKTITGHSALKKNYKKYLSSLDKKRRKVKKSAIEIFLEAFEKCSMSMGENEVKIVNKIDLVTKLLETLYKSDLRFGGDFSNGHVSGNINSAKRLDAERFVFIAKDNNNFEYRFKFKNLLILMPKVGEPLSPILLFEADDDTIDEKYSKYIETDHDGRKSISGLCFEDEDRIEWDREKLHDLYMESEYDEYFSMPRNHGVEHFLSTGLVCFIDVHMLDYGNLREILRKYGKTSLKKLEVSFRSNLKNDA